MLFIKVAYCLSATAATLPKVASLYTPTNEERMPLNAFTMASLRAVSSSICCRSSLTIKI